MTRTVILVGLVTLAVASGCAKSDVYFRPAQAPRAAGGGWGAKAQYALPDPEQNITVEVAARGTITEREDQIDLQRIRVRFEIQNTSPQAFTLQADQAHIVDDEGRTVTEPNFAGENVTTDAVVVPPEGKIDADLIFKLPPEIRFDTLGSFRLVWPYRVGEKAHTLETKFIKVEEVVYQSPYYYDPYYPPYAYSPYRYRHPYHYGPGGYWRMGYGYGYWYYP